MHLSEQMAGWEAAEPGRPNRQHSSPSGLPVEPCRPFSLCTSSAASSLSSAAASPPWPDLCLLSAKSRRKNDRVAGGA